MIEGWRQAAAQDEARQDAHKRQVYMEGGQDTGSTGQADRQAGADEQEVARDKRQ